MPSESTPSEYVESPAPKLLARLAEMARRVRRLLVMYGLALLMLICVSSLLIVILLDYWLWFPPLLRAAFGFGWLVLLSWFVTQHVVLPFKSRNMQLRLATRIEQAFPEFEDCLSSAISFMRDPAQLAQEPLQQKLIERTEALAQTIPIEKAIVPRSTWRMICLALLPAVILIYLGLTQPRWLGLGVQRLAIPLAAADWPRRVNIQPQTGDVVIARGESVVLAMRVTRGQSEDIRAVLHVRNRVGESQQFVMRREGEDRYAWTLPAVSDDLAYWFSAGDDDTRDEAGWVQVVDRPRAENTSVKVSPPPYAISHKPESLPASQREIKMFRGGRVRFDFHASQPVAISESGTLQAGLRSAEGELIAAKADADDPQQLRVEVQPDSDEAYSILLEAASGFSAADADTFQVRVLEDQPPTAHITQSSSSLTVTPGAIITLEGTARDDLGVERVWLAGTIQPGNRPLNWPVPISTSGDQSTGEPVVLSVQYDWLLQPLQLSVGDHVTFALFAADNRRFDNLEPQQGQSHTVSLQIVSLIDFAALMSDELARLGRQLESVLNLQQQVQGDIASLQNRWAQSPDLDTDAELLRLITRAKDIAARLQSQRQQAQRLQRDMEHNGLTTGRERRQADLVVDRLAEVIEPGMQQAGVLLGEARRESGRGAAQLEKIDQAQQQAQRVTDALRQLLEAMKTWDDFNSALAGLWELIDEQQHINQSTAELQKQTLGQAVEDLPQELADKLKHNALQQSRLTDQIRQTLGQIDQLRERLLRLQPDDALALGQVLRELRGQQVQERSEQASDAIRENRTSQALEQQHQVERALAQAVSEMEQRVSRELEALTKQISQIEEILAFLLTRQQALLEQTRRIQDASALPQLAKPQQTLKESTLEVVNQLAELKQGDEPLLETQRAADEMSRAVDALYGADAPPADRAQSRVIVHLQKAIERLMKLRDEAEKAKQREQLFAIQRTLKEIRKQQLTINADTEKTVDRIREAGRLTRRDTRAVRNCAQQQEAQIQQLDSVLDKLSEAPVYLWMVRRVRDAMQQSHERLTSRQLDAPLLASQQRVISLLDQLIEAVKQAESMVDDKYAESGGDGGGAGSGQGEQQPSNPVPTLAELLVLRTIQQNLLQQTQSLYDSMDPNRPTELELQQVRDLSEDQRQLMSLTRDLTIKARQ